MMTVLIVGSTGTRVTDGYVYTPRGYGAKRGSGESTAGGWAPSPDVPVLLDRRST